jgi:hypothetical protein
MVRGISRISLIAVISDPSVQSAREVNGFAVISTIYASTCVIPQSKGGI